VVLGATVGRVYAPAIAVATSSRAGTVTLRQGWEGEAPPGIPQLFDPRLPITSAISDRSQWNAYLSWLAVGASLSHAPAGISARVPLIMTAGVQVADPPGSLGVAWEGRIAVSVEPILGRSSGSCSAPISALVRAGS